MCLPLQGDLPRLHISSERFQLCVCARARTVPYLGKRWTDIKHQQLLAFSETFLSFTADSIVGDRFSPPTSTRLATAEGLLTRRKALSLT